MHFIHIIHLFFKFQGKGKFVFPIALLSYLLVFRLYFAAQSILKFGSYKYETRLLSAITLLLAGIILWLVTKKYFLNDEGERVYYQQEGEYIYIKVSAWIQIFIGLGIAIILSTIADFYKLG